MGASWDIAPADPLKAAAKPVYPPQLPGTLVEGAGIPKHGGSRVLRALIADSVDKAREFVNLTIKRGVASPPRVSIMPHFGFHYIRSYSVNPLRNQQ
jgi:hypothetical protein